MERERFAQVYPTRVPVLKIVLNVVSRIFIAFEIQHALLRGTVNFFATFSIFKIWGQEFLTFCGAIIPSRHKIPVHQYQRNYLFYTNVL